MATKTVGADIDLSKMSVEDMIEMSHKLADEAKKKGQKMFDETMTFLAEKLKAMGRTKEEAMGALYTLMNAEEKADFTSRFKQYVGVSSGPRAPRAARGTKPAKEYKDKDSTGARPEAGKTYVLNGQSWTKAANGLGATKREFVDAIKGGAVWSELLKK